MSLDSTTRDEALDSIAKGLGWKPSERPHWPALVLDQLERDGLTITRSNDGSTR